MKLNFIKMQGLGNDFMVMDTIRQKIPLSTERIRQWGDRHFGIGFDQLLLVEPPKNASTDFYYRIFNFDGSESGQCGNGARCIARYIHDEKLSDKRQLKIQTYSSEMQTELHEDNQVSVSMGIPQISKIQLDTQHEFLSGEKYFVDMGNPHLVLFVPQFSGFSISEVALAATNSGDFPSGVNVEFVQVINPSHIRLRVYERGVGETLACGSGACAAVAVGQTLRLLDQQVTVDLLGGTLEISWKGNQNPIMMKGSAERVYSGAIEI
ncbi:MAG: diaminopimelate epimerase [Proteobacteria bacterium]|nr:diaminopimelate epimerase [Pseudomonadota bacterium]